MPKEPMTRSSSGFALAIDGTTLNRAKAPVLEIEPTKGAGPVVELPVSFPAGSAKANKGVPTGEAANIHRQVILTDTAVRQLDQFVEGVAEAMKCRGLTASHVVRALLGAAAHAQEHINQELSRFGPQKVPQNGRGREMERDRLEAKITAAIVQGFRSCPALDKLKNERA